MDKHCQSHVTHALANNHLVVAAVVIGDDNLTHKRHFVGNVLTVHCCSWWSWAMSWINLYQKYFFHCLVLYSCFSCNLKRRCSCTFIYQSVGLSKHDRADGITAAYGQMHTYYRLLMTRKASHPQYTKGILRSRMMDRKIRSPSRMSYDAVGCVSRLGTSPEPLVPELMG